MDVVVENVTQIWGGERTQVTALDSFSHRFRSRRFRACSAPALRQEHADSNRRRLSRPPRYGAQDPERVTASVRSGGFCDGLAEPQPVSVAQRHR